MTSLIERLRHHRLALFLLIATPAILYYKVLAYDFSPMDEQWLILRKLDYLKDWSNLWKGFADGVAQTYYRPLLTVTFIIDAHLGGDKAFFYHLTNLVLHIICTLLLYRFLLLVTTQRTPSLLLALLFAVHPAIVHAVAWIPGRNDVLLAIFSLASFISLWKYTETGSGKFLVWHFMAFACALLSKESAAFLPVVYAALLYCRRWPLQRWLVPALTWVLLIAGWYIVKVTVLPKVDAPVPKSAACAALNMVEALLIYVGNSVWPVSPSVTPTVENSSVLWGCVAFALLAVLSYVVGFRSKKLAALGALIFFGCLLLPVYFGASSILREHYEHRIYLSLAGFFIYLSQLRIPVERTWSRVIFAVIAVAFFARSWTRFPVYGDELLYTTEGIEDSPKNYVYHLLKANALFNRKHLNESLIYYGQAIQLQPNRVQALANRANVYVMMGEKELALADLNAALKIDQNPNLYLNRFNTYYVFKDYEHALVDFEKLKTMSDVFTLDIPPQVDQTLNNYKKERDAKQRVAAAEQFISKEPKNALWHVHLAKAQADLKHWPEALAELKIACELEPGNADYRSFYETLKKSMAGR